MITFNYINLGRCSCYWMQVSNISLTKVFEKIQIWLKQLHTGKFCSYKGLVLENFVHIRASYYLVIMPMWVCFLQTFFPNQWDQLFTDLLSQSMGSAFYRPSFPINGISFGIPLLNFMSGKIFFSVLNDKGSFFENL